MTARADGIIELGPNAADVFALIGVNPTLTPKGRRRFAFECLDATERAPHLAGALGDALATSLTDRRWIQHAASGRIYSLTPTGRKKLHTALGLRQPAMRGSM